MPHLTLEFSPGLFMSTDHETVLREINEAIIATGSINKESDLKTRMFAREWFLIGTQDEPRGFVYAQLRVLPGRTPEMRSTLAQSIAGVIRQHCHRPDGVALQLSVEVVEMDGTSYVKGPL